MKRYSEMLTKTASKLMRDLASLLDSPLLQVENFQEWQRSETAAIREEIFHDFCALCAQFGLPVPEMEEILISAQLPNVDKKMEEAHTVRFKTFIEPALAELADHDSDEAELCLVFLRCLANLPSLSGHSGLTGKQMECLINQRLLKLGAKPARPDYHAREVKGCNQNPAKRETKVMIVDDDTKSIIKTARALAGWGNLNISFYRQKCDGNTWRMKPEEKQTELKKTAQAIVVLKSDVILMDQGLSGIEGDDLIPVILGLRSSPKPVFVANTDGSDEKLLTAGALENCGKGRNLQGVAAAIRRFEMKGGPTHS